jgi:hypothetical protein
LSLIVSSHIQSRKSFPGNRLPAIPDEHYRAALAVVAVASASVMTAWCLPILAPLPMDDVGAAICGTMTAL